MKLVGDLIDDFVEIGDELGNTSAGLSMKARFCSRRFDRRRLQQRGNLVSYIGMNGKEIAQHVLNFGSDSECIGEGNRFGGSLWDEAADQMRFGIGLVIGRGGSGVGRSRVRN